MTSPTDPDAGRELPPLPEPDMQITTDRPTKIHSVQQIQAFALAACAERDAEVERLKALIADIQHSTGRYFDEVCSKLAQRDERIIDFQAALLHAKACTALLADPHPGLMTWSCALFEVLENLAGPHPALHASAPTDHHCADCTMEQEPCPTCYYAWWSKRHPNTFEIGGYMPARRSALLEALDLFDKEHLEDWAVRRYREKLISLMAAPQR